LKKQAMVTLRIVDARGVTVQTHELDVRDAGSHSFHCQFMDAASGVYFYQIIGTDFSSDFGKMLYLK
jgi:hypothetical protein